MAQAHKKLEPLPDTKKQMKPITRDGFKAIIKKAITTPAPKPAPKSP